MRIITHGKIRDWLPRGKTTKVGPFWLESAMTIAEWWEGKGYSVVAKKVGEEYYLYKVKK